MIFPMWMSLARHRPAVSRSKLAARCIRLSPPFVNVTLPLSLPGMFAAAIFGFVGSFGESAVPLIIGGVGYQLMGNTITSTLDVLNYPLAAAISSVAIGLMLALLIGWYRLFDVRLLLGKIVGRA